MKVAVLGHALVDYVYLVESISTIDDEYRIIRDVRYPGGSALNTAVGLINLGSEPLLIANIGSDDRGLFLLTFLREKGISLSGVRTVKGESGYCIVIRDVMGNVLLYSKLNVAEPLVIDDQVASLLVDVDHIHVTSLSIASLRNVLRIVENMGLRVTMSWDIGRVTAKEGWEAVNQYLRFFDIVFVSQRELEHVSKNIGITDFLKIMRNHFRGVLIVKKGRRGITVYSREGRIIEAYFSQPVVVIDSLGAGDAFASCYLHHRLKGLDEEEVIRKSVIFSTLKVGYEGGSTMPLLDEFEKEFKSLSGKVVVKNFMVD
ncbi:MAG: carbohydrate kinase family protein [Thermosphaera sp.]